MRKSEFIKEFKVFLNERSLNCEQINYLENIYKDESSVIGIYNTFSSAENIMNIGLKNYDWHEQKTNDLSNTVMYNDALPILINYAGGGRRRTDKAVILKIPKRILERKQGIFERLIDNSYGIPPQFIIATFSDGQIIENRKYNPNYYSQNAEKCKETNIIYYNKKENISYTNLYLNGSRLSNIIKKIKEMFNKTDVKLLNAPEGYQPEKIFKEQYKFNARKGMLNRNISVMKKINSKKGLQQSEK